jgi:hypothetical protein
LALTSWYVCAGRAINLRSGRDPCDGRSGRQAPHRRAVETPLLSALDRTPVAHRPGSQARDRPGRLGCATSPASEDNRDGQPPARRGAATARQPSPPCPRIARANFRRTRGVPSRLASVPVQSFRCAPPRPYVTGPASGHAIEKRSVPRASVSLMMPRAWQAPVRARFLAVNLDCDPCQKTEGI